MAVDLAKHLSNLPAPDWGFNGLGEIVTWVDGVKESIGPAIEDGFYYDFARDEPFSLDDLEKIEKRMKEIVDRDEKITREVWDREEAIKHFDGIGEQYKAQIIRDLPPTDTKIGRAHV